MKQLISSSKLAALAFLVWTLSSGPVVAQEMSMDIQNMTIEEQRELLQKMKRKGRGETIPETETSPETESLTETKPAKKANANTMRLLGEGFTKLEWLVPEGEGKAWFRKALEQYRKDAEQGNIDAMIVLGEVHLEISSGSIYREYMRYTFGDQFFDSYIENYDEAAAWFRKALEQYRKNAEQGNVDAMIWLGREYLDLGWYELMELGIKEDRQEALAWFQKAGEKAFEQGNAAMMYSVHDSLPFHEDQREAWYMKALEQYRKDAEQGNVDAMIWLGEHHQFGEHFSKMHIKADSQEAEAWFRKVAEKAIEQGNADMMYSIASRMDDFAERTYGILPFTREDWQNKPKYNKLKEEFDAWYRKALEQYRKDAEQGNVDAMIWLGRWYHDGKDVEADSQEAEAWFRKAAEKAIEQGNADMMCSLGKLYYDYGDDTRDKETANSLYRKAAEQFMKAAEQYRKDVE